VKILGLTGSIATGKSFVAEIFRQNNIKIFSSDQDVAELLQNIDLLEEIKTYDILKQAFSDNKLSKETLSKIVFNNEQALKILEEIIHPKVKNNMLKFIEDNYRQNFIILEVPLLFEKNYDQLCYKVITTFCHEKLQEERALRRKNMDLERLNFIISRQMPSHEKAKRTDYLVCTDLTYNFSQNQVKQILLKEGI
jgi:dephospho-CoA kinase